MANEGNLLAVGGWCDMQHATNLPLGNTPNLTSAIKVGDLEAVFSVDVAGPHSLAGLAKNARLTDANAVGCRESSRGAAAMGEEVCGPSPLKQRSVATMIRDDRFQAIRRIQRYARRGSDTEVNLQTFWLCVKASHRPQRTVGVINDRRTVSTRVTNVALLGAMVGVLAQIMSSPIHRPKLGLRLWTVVVTHVGAEQQPSVDPTNSVSSGCSVATVVIVIAVTQQA